MLPGELGFDPHMMDCFKPLKIPNFIALLWLETRPFDIKLLVTQ